MEAVAYFPTAVGRCSEPLGLRVVGTLLQAQEGSNGREGQQSAQLRPLAISLICGMAHSTQRTRAELWAHNGLELLLGLLQEQVGYILGSDSLRSLRPTPMLSVPG